MNERELRRKLTFRAHGKTLVLVKRPGEKLEHRLMMALTWAIYLPRYPDLRIDVPIDSRYRPDLVQLTPDARPCFWGECGEVSADKLRTLCRRYRDTHLVFTRWGASAAPFAPLIAAAIDGTRRSAPVELIRFDDDDRRFVDENGAIAAAIAEKPVERWG